MKPLVITGPSANSGKTELACRLLAIRPGTQTLKITRFHREAHCPVHGVDEHGHDACDGCDDAPAGYEIITDPARINMADKDTGRLVSAGGNPVLWLRAAPHAFAYALRSAISRFDLNQPLLIEGNSAATQPWLDATVVVLWPQYPRGVKSSVIPALRRADKLLVVEAPTDPRKRIPPSLLQACNRAGLELAQIAEPQWLGSNWWQSGQEQPSDTTIIGGLGAFLV